MLDGVAGIFKGIFGGVKPRALPRDLGQAPLWLELVDLARKGPLAASPWHGEAHWRAVAAIGLDITELRPGVSRDIVLAFGLLHDCRRFDEDDDPGHGARAAEVIQQSTAAQNLLGADGRETLARACQGHTHERRSDDPTIGTCWDADRFNLLRLDMTLRPEFLSGSWTESEVHHLSLRARLHIVAPPTWDEMIFVDADQTPRISLKTHF
jgi:uncharacterized protein